MNFPLKLTVWMIFLGSLCVGFMLNNQQNPKATHQIYTAPIFEKIPASKSGITFSNQVVADLATRENLFDFDFFYNGSGLGVADLNNDGLQDIFFASNQGKNALYLNKGDLIFEDISDRAGINKGKQWSNGVSFADINQDGYLDIYISQGGPKGDPLNGEARRNLLYINRGDLTFTEEAQAYGLADEGLSTQSIFFDYDKDGDLDCLVGNENYLFGMDPVKFYQTLLQDPALMQASSSHLYRNDGGKFTDISKEAKILRPSFALGIIVSDINQDGWLDIYFSNDYFIPDYTYINQGDGTFKDENKKRISHTSFYGMGVDIADINNDGHQDIFVLDMASSDHYRSKTLMRSMSVSNFRMLINRFKFNHQYMFNSLQLNLGNGHYQNIEHFSGTAKTDWSWAGLMADYDNDGYKDIYVTNGYRRYALDNDFQTEVIAAKQKYEGQVPIYVKRQLYKKMPTEKLSNYMFHNQGNLHFESTASDWGLDDPSYSNGAVYADLDNDGDLELIVNNIDEQAFVYKNLSREQKIGNYLQIETIGLQSESFARVYLKSQGSTQVIENSRVRGYLSSVSDIAHFGLGDQKFIDTLRVEWPSGKYQEQYRIKRNRRLTFYEKDAQAPEYQQEWEANIYFKPSDHHALGLTFTHKENYYDDFEKEILLPYRQSTLGPFITKGDINGDQREDIFIGGAAKQAAHLYIQTDDGFQEWDSPALQADAHFEDMEAILADFDEDGDQDLFVVSGGNAYPASAEQYADRLYWNDGKGNFSKALDTPFDKEENSGKSVCSIDFDRDGDMDLVVGNRIIPQGYPKFAPSHIYRNDAGTFTEVSEEVAPDLASFGIINQVIDTDFDGDGWTDLIVVGEWTHIGLLKNEGGTFRDISHLSGLDASKGWWFSIAETDINNDGKKDYLIGNLGLNSKFKTSQDKPFKVFANDFDHNGSLDIVLSSKQGDEYLPVRGKECSSQQMPFISKKFPTYHEFAKANLQDIYGFGLQEADEFEATTFSSVLLLNEGGGLFRTLSLPEKAQLFPVLSAVFMDINEDGFEDVILSGNIYNTEVETSRLDGGSGLLLFSDGNNNYYPPSTGNGLYLSGNTKDLELIYVEAMQTSLLLASKNNGELVVLSLER